MIAIDMDGTLLNTSGVITPRTRDALQAAERAGIEVVISTGRRHCYAMRVLRDLQLRPESAVVSSNGTVIRTIGSRLLHRTQLPRHTAAWLVDHLREYRNTLVLTFDNVTATGEDTRGSLVVEQLDDLHASISAWMRSNAPWIARVVPIERALEGPQPIQMMLCGTIERMRAAEALLLEHDGVSAVGATPLENAHGAEVALHRTEYPENDLCIVDILPAGVSKASALLLLAEQRGLGAADILAIGDNWNDVSMLDMAGQSVLMANAPADLRGLALQGRWPLGASNDEDGVAIAIEASLAHALTSA